MLDFSPIILSIILNSLVHLLFLKLCRYNLSSPSPDGITVVLWKSGRLLVWDATCPDTFAPSYLPSAASGVGAVAAAAEEWKKRKYSHLDQCHLFVPVAIETTGVFGPETMEFLWELGRRLQLVSADHNSFTYLIQRLSVAVQRGNAASVLGTAAQGTWTLMISLRPLDFVLDCMYCIFLITLLDCIVSLFFASTCIPIIYPDRTRSHVRRSLMDCNMGLPFLMSFPRP